MARDELLTALKVMRERHQIDDPHHADMCEFCKQADSAITNAELMNSFAQQIATLKKCALDAAAEIDWLKNAPAKNDEELANASALVERLYAACAALGDCE